MSTREEVYREIEEYAKESLRSYRAVPKTPEQWWEKIGSKRYQGLPEKDRDRLLELVFEIWMCTEKDCDTCIS